MILQNMSPEEKLAQIDILHPIITHYAKGIDENKFAPLRRASRYPAYLFCKERDIKGMGKWTIVVEAGSKKDASKGRFSIFAIQSFYVPKAKNPINIGTGLYIYHPQVGNEPWLEEFPPHYLNRVRQRLIEPKGVVQPDFNGLIREVFRLNYHAMMCINEGTVVSKGEDGMYDIIKDPARQRQEGYDNFAAYHKEGITLGVSKNIRYFHFTTFVSNDLLRQGQLDMQNGSLADKAKHELNLRYEHNKGYREEKIVKKADF